VVLKPLKSSICAVPFEEDTQDPTIWFMDHSYMENMSRMFRKVNGAVTYIQLATMCSERQKVTVYCPREADYWF
jgi:hypothetical protein